YLSAAADTQPNTSSGRASARSVDHCTGHPEDRIPRIASGRPRAHEPRAHQVHEVVAVEAVLRPLPQPLDTLLEAPERVPPALDVRVVGGEQAHLLARLLDDPADGLVRVGRDADLAPHVLARAELEAPEPLRALAESVP